MVAVRGPGAQRPSGPLPAAVLRLLVTAGLTLVAWLLITALSSSSTAEAAASGRASDPACATGDAALSEQHTGERNSALPGLVDTTPPATSTGIEATSTENSICEPHKTAHSVEPARPAADEPDESDESDESGSQAGTSAELAVPPDAAEPHHQAQPESEPRPIASSPTELRDEAEPVQRQQPGASLLDTITQAITHNVENVVHTATASTGKTVNSTVDRVVGTITNTVNDTVQPVTDLVEFPYGTGLGDLSGVDTLLPDRLPLPLPASPFEAPSPSAAGAPENSECDEAPQLRSDSRPEPAVPYVAQTLFTAFDSPIPAAVQTSDLDATDHQNGPVNNPAGNNRGSPLPAAPMTFNSATSNTAVHQDGTAGSNGEQGIQNEAPPPGQLRMIGTSHRHNVGNAVRNAALPTTSPD